jgi:hypothetical protein
MSTSSPALLLSEKYSAAAAAPRYVGSEGSNIYERTILAIAKGMYDNLSRLRGDIEPLYNEVVAESNGAHHDIWGEVSENGASQILYICFSDKKDAFKLIDKIDRTRHIPVGKSHIQMRSAVLTDANRVSIEARHCRL